MSRQKVINFDPNTIAWIQWKQTSLTEVFILTSDIHTLKGGSPLRNVCIFEATHRECHVIQALLMTIPLLSIQYSMHLIFLEDILTFEMAQSCLKGAETSQIICYIICESQGCLPSHSCFRSINELALSYAMPLINSWRHNTEKAHKRSNLLGKMLT